jgi:DnaJ-class molecular chaperone
MKGNCWILRECPDCLGSGMKWCSKCEDPCEHDDVCERCDGTGLIPGRDAVPFPFMFIAEGLAYRSRQHALRSREDLL